MIDVRTQLTVRGVTPGPGLYKEAAGQANHREQASKQHSSMVSALLLLSGSRAPGLPSLMDCDLED